MTEQERLELDAAAGFALEDGVLGGRLALAAAPPARVSGRPHLTVSQSEAGFEKIMQAAELTLSWTIPADDWRITLQLTVETLPQP